MPSTNEEILDRVVVRTLQLQRLVASEKRVLFSSLRRLERDLVAALAAYDPGGVERMSARQLREQRLLAEARDLVRVGFRGMRDDFARRLGELASVEAKWMVATVDAAVGVDVMGAALSGQTLRTVASDTLVQGARSADWWGRQAQHTVEAFSDRVRVGVLRGDPTPEIVRAVRGTAAAGYKDGIGLHGAGGRAAREAEALVRTSVQAVANQSRVLTLEENSDLVEEVEWVSTLDNRTTLTCMALHGKRWRLPDYQPVGHDMKWPGPTAHWNCRSTQVPVVKSWDELSEGRVAHTEAGGRASLQGAFEQKLRDMGMPEDQIGRAVAGARASMDGQVPVATTFDDWLKGKSAKVQEQLLGKGRAALFREGKVTLSQLVSQDGRPLRLDQLAQMR